MTDATPSIKHTANRAADHAAMQELVLAIRRDLLFGARPPEGLMQGVVRKNIAQFEQKIRQFGQFLPRAIMEEDERYKQVIPYFVFTHNSSLFLMQRSSKASEQRLASKYTLGIGGHVRKDDVDASNIAEWGQREFKEEVSYNGAISLVPLGILNDESTPVGRVHVGIVYLLHGDSPDIAIKSELASGALCSREECEQRYDQMEPWSQQVFDVLKKARYI